MNRPREKFSKLRRSDGWTMLFFDWVLQTQFFMRESNVNNLLRRICGKLAKNSFRMIVYYGPTMGRSREKFSKLRLSEGWKALF